MADTRKFEALLDEERKLHWNDVYILPLSLQAN